MTARATRARVKRAGDIALVLLLAPIVTPIGLATAAVVAMTVGHPVLFTQERVGLGERVFNAYKFRTMSDRRGADGELLPDSQRLTRVGRFLRKTSIDEIPQLINVLRGDMSFVGPRPLLVRYLPHYREHERARHEVRPGITGAAQVSGRNSLLWDDRLRLDAEYARHGSLPDDLRIMMLTVRKVFAREGVSVIAGDSGEPLDVVRSYPSRDGAGLRRLETVDAETRVRWFQDPRVSRTMNVPREITAKGTAEWILSSRRDQSRRDFVAYDVATGAPQAMLGLRGIEAGTPEVFVVVDPDLHGRGIGRTSMELLLQWMQESGDYEGCWLTVDPDNVPAMKLYTSLGFTVIDRESAPDRLSMVLSWGRPR